MKIIKDIANYYKNNKRKSIVVLILIVLACLIFAWKLTILFLIISWICYVWKKGNDDKKNNKTVKSICPHCKEEVNSEASLCPHCKGKIYVWTTGRKVLVGVIFLTIFILIITGAPGSKSNTSVQSIQYDKEINSTVFAEKTIKDILKAPSTAKFVDVQAYELSNEKDVWAVNGYVDSQNSYGAMIRNQWEVQLDYRDGKGGTVKSILFDGKKM
jgi:hypothetical protein